MNPHDPSLQAALDTASPPIRATLAAVAGRVSETPVTQGQASGRVAERDQLNTALFELRRNMPLFQRTFANEMSTRIRQELMPKGSGGKKLADADWQSLSLVGDAEMEELMFADRLGQQISHACEAELRELATYMGSLLGIGRADQDRNPLRAEVVGASLYRAIESVSTDADTRKVLARELGAAMAK